MENEIPMSTTDYRKQYTQTNYDFPNLHLSEDPILFVNTLDPISTYAQDMNLRTAQRYNFPTHK